MLMRIFCVAMVATVGFVSFVGSVAAQTARPTMQETVDWLFPKIVESQRGNGVTVHTTIPQVSIMLPTGVGYFDALDNGERLAQFFAITSVQLRHPDLTYKPAEFEDVFQLDEDLPVCVLRVKSIEFSNSTPAYSFMSTPVQNVRHEVEEVPLYKVDSISAERVTDLYDVYQIRLFGDLKRVNLLYFNSDWNNLRQGERMVTAFKRMVELCQDYDPENDEPF